MPQDWDLAGRVLGTRVLGVLHAIADRAALACCAMWAQPLGGCCVMRRQPTDGCHASFSRDSATVAQGRSSAA